jgi:NADH:ubiquinone oxidoreductase subunit F (NADH-binding)/(2Fe-2S) ferredoxin/Pyruvate/2-oxoacid:ferredoxin oxidoreductase delta subunit
MTGTGNLTLHVCQGTGCVSSKSPDIQAALEKEIAAAGISGRAGVKLTGCHGFCQRGPIVIVEPEGIFYSEVKPEDAPEIVRSHLVDGKPVERLFYRDPVGGNAVPFYRDITFYAKQQRVVLRNCGHINPELIDDYIAAGGYKAVRKALLQMKPEQVIAEIKRSGLRGRGGAGFPTGQKWEFCRQAPAGQKYLICNADEGDPGAFMDRSVLEADPHSVIEGMVIASFAIGATEGYIYVRAEYPLAVQRVHIAIKRATERGFLGKDILGSGHSFELHVKEGAGAFVCGEETALMMSIEGRRGMPRPRPPFPAQSGLWGRPTIINNVKSLATVPVIIDRGADWFASIGTEKSKGTVVFALTGLMANCGLVEVPLGITLRETIFTIGGGLLGGRKFKAVQTGGPSGGCIPASLLDTPVDYDSLNAAGTIMGSGGMVVMDDRTCMVDIARYFINFTMQESCGKCVPCRQGTRQMLEILTDITQGRGRPGDIELLQELGEAVKAGSLCGLGQTAPNPVLSTIRYFKDEYEAHIREKRCPALACKALLSYAIDAQKCAACGLCKRACPSEAITGEKKKPHVIDPAKCIRCGSCFDACPKKFGAVIVSSGDARGVA